MLILIITHHQFILKGVRLSTPDIFEYLGYVNKPFVFLNISGVCLFLHPSPNDLGTSFILRKIVFGFCSYEDQFQKKDQFLLFAHLFVQLIFIGADL